MGLLEHRPILERRRDGALAWWTDPVLEEHGVRIAFSERTGGTSAAPFQSLNLAAHVGDDPVSVDSNRDRILSALGLRQYRSRVTTADQVHGSRVETITEKRAGAGAYASTGFGDVPVAATDALVTAAAGVPLLLLFADCVPIVLVAPGPVVAVVHAGWRGALDEVARKAASELARIAGCDPSALLGYIGPHIGHCHYPVDERILSQFVNTFDTVARAKSGGLDLDAVVRRSLTDAGVSLWRITSLGACTAEETGRFYSYRAEFGRTGRHGAFACVLPSSA